MTATATQSCWKGPKNKTAFFVCRATDSLWSRKVVALVVLSNVPLLLLLEPWTCVKIMEQFTWVRHRLLVTSHLQEIPQDLFI